MSSRIVSLLCGATLAACGAGEPGGTGPDPAPPGGSDGAPSPTGAPTYYRDVLPVLDAHCLRCHTEGGIGPFALDTYDDAAPLAPIMALVTDERIMPPYLADTSCNDYRGAERGTLTDAQIALFAAWSEAGAPAGDPADAPPLSFGDDEPDMGEPDIVLQTAEPFVFDHAREDLYWCIRFDPGIDEPVDFTKLAVMPDNRGIVHHVIVFREPGGAANPTGLPGFECNPTPPGTEFFFGWAPGTEPLALPTGTAMRLQPDDALVMQVHYHATPGAAPESDHTRLGMFTADGDVEELVRVVWTGSIFIDAPPGVDASAQGTCAVPPNAGPIKVLGMSPHMHEIGTSISATVARADGGDTCLIDVPRWDFEWQNGFFFEQPVELYPGDTIHTTCTYFNPTSTPVGFGEGTGDEMCFVFHWVVDDGTLPEMCFEPCNFIPCDSFL